MLVPSVATLDGSMLLPLKQYVSVNLRLCSFCCPPTLWWVLLCFDLTEWGFLHAQRGTRFCSRAGPKPPSARGSIRNAGPFPNAAPASPPDVPARHTPLLPPALSFLLCPPFLVQGVSSLGGGGGGGRHDFSQALL